MSQSGTWPYVASPERAALTKSVVIGVRFTPDEAEGLRADATRHGLSVPDYIRACLTIAEIAQAPKAAPALTPCGDIVAGGCTAYDPECGACDEANSDAPEWSL